jgi:hypothetical protein
VFEKGTERVRKETRESTHTHTHTHTHTRIALHKIFIDKCEYVCVHESNLDFQRPIHTVMERDVCAHNEAAPVRAPIIELVLRCVAHLPVVMLQLLPHLLGHHFLSVWLCVCVCEYEEYIK